VTTDTGPATRTSRPPGVVSAALAVVWTLAVLVGLVFLPVYSTASGGASSDGTTFSTTSEETLLEHEGTSVLVVLLVPVAVAFIGLVGAAFRVRPMSVVAAVIAVGLCVLGMASIGIFYLPAGLLLVVAAARSTAPHP
jgi:hypothetical protein